MNHSRLLPLLLPPVSYDPQGPNIAIDLTASGAALDRAQASARRVRDAITPYGAGALIQDWERVLGITPPADAGYQERQNRVIAKIRELGGLSIPYFIRLAAGLGYSVTIDEPQPFRAGTSRAGDRLYVEDIVFVWRVDVRGGSALIYRFRAGQSAAGERLTTFGDPILEATIRDLKPAHTFVYFAYEDAA